MTDSADHILIGIDCAVQPANIGIAAGRVVDGVVVVDRLHAGHANPAAVIAEAISAPAVLAFDSPLGWPADLGRTLASHRAGDRIAVEPNTLFRRETDRFVKQVIGKQSLDVGADRIARTAHAALGLLADVRDLSEIGIEIAVSQSDRSDALCFEVYPAATLKAHGIDARGYKGKKPENRSAREKLIEALEPRLRIEEALVGTALATDDALDAAICCLAAADFLAGHCYEPRDAELAAKEGWIWVRAAELA